MKIMSMLLAGFGVLVVVGCTYVPVQVDEGKIRAATFSFMEPKQGKTASFAENRAEIHGMIQKSIASHLAIKGLTQVRSGGDVTVAYLVVVSSNVTTAAISDYFGYGDQSKLLAQRASKGTTRLREEREEGRVRNPNKLMVGALLIDVIDAQSLELLYRNFSYRELLSNASDEQRQERIRTVVDEVLDDLRVAPLR